MKRILCFLLLLPCFWGVCHAEWQTEQVSAYVDQVEKELGEEERELSGKLRLDGQYDTEGALSRMWDKLLEKGKKQLEAELASVTGILALSVLTALCASCCPDEAQQRAADRIACCAAALLLTGDTDSLFQQAADSLLRLSDYSRAAMPAVYTAAAASGAAVSAPLKYGAASMSMELLISLGQRFILPLIKATLAIGISGSLIGGSILPSLWKCGKWLTVTAMTVLTMGFVSYLSLTGVLAGSTDALAVKTARTVISSAIPVVGGILSDSAAAALSAAAVIRNSAGVFALMGVCALCIGPVALFSVKYLLFRAVSVFTDLFQGSRLSALIGNIGTVMGMLLGLVCSCAMMLFISICAAIRTVAG